MQTVGLVAVDAVVQERENNREEEEQKQRGFTLKDIKDFSLPFWLLLFGSSVFYMIVLPFVGIAQVFFKQKYSYQLETANIANGLIYVVPAITLPLLGLLFDRTGYKLFWGLGAIVIAILSHILLAFTRAAFVVPILATMFLGLTFSMYVTAVWLQVFLLVQEHQSATAYGVLNCGTQIGEGVAVLLVGIIVDQLGYFLVEIFFIILGQLSLVLIFALYLTPKGRLLNVSGIKRRTAKLLNGSIVQSESTSEKELLESRSSDYR